MSGAIQKDAKAKVASLMDVLTKRTQTFHDLLPPDMGEKRGEWFLAEVKVAAARAPKLADCTTISIVDALTTCAQLGLSPSGRLGSAYLIPYKDKCTLVIGYRGYADLAYRSGDVAAFHAEVVYQKDEWVHEEGLEPILKHRRSEDEDPGQLRAVYAIAKMKDGTSAHVVMLRREALVIKQKSLAKKRSDSPPTPWETDEAEMWKKTAVRRLIKLLPLSPTKAKWLHRAEETERAQEEAIEGDFVLSDEQPPSGIERAKAAVKALAPQRETMDGAWVEPADAMAKAKAMTAAIASFEPDDKERAEILAAEHEAAGK